MFRNKLFRKNIEPHCTYCVHACELDETHMTCRKKGIVPREGKCRAFKYNPLMRIPPKPAVMKMNFKEEEFRLEENDE